MVNVITTLKRADQDQGWIVARNDRKGGRRTMSHNIDFQ